jgi:hypothetical protein
MLPAKSVIRFKGKISVFAPRFSLEKAVAAVKKTADPFAAVALAGLVPPKGAQLLADASKAGGLSGKEISKLKRARKVRWLEIRTTAAFAPALCAAFLLKAAGLY